MNHLSMGDFGFSKLRRFVFAATIWMSVFPAMAGVLQLTDAPYIDLSANFEVFVDETKSLSVDQVVALQPNFRPVQEPDLVRKYDSRVFWLRMTLLNATQFPMERWLDIGHPRLESVKLYQRREGAWNVMNSGVSVPKDEKLIHGAVAFPLKIAPGERQELWMRVQSRTSLDLKSALWIPLKYQQNEQNRRLLMVAGFGGSLIVTFISLSILFRSRELNFLLFGTLHLFAGLMELGREGIWEEFFWPASLPFPIELHAITGVIALGSLIVVQMRLLDLKVTYPRLSLTHTALAFVLLAWMPIAWFNYEVWIRGMSFMVIALGFLSLGVFVALWGKGNEIAGYLFWGYLSFWSLEALRGAAGLFQLNIEFTKTISVTWALLLSTPLFFFALIEKSRKLDYEVRQFQELYKAKSLFLAKVSHELHSPLNTIIGYARMLRRKSERLSVEEGAYDIERNGLRLLKMLDDLLDQSRIENSHLTLNPAPVNLTKWLKEVQRIGMVMTEESGNSFVFSVEGVMPTGVMFDAARLLQILDNLISNANRHTRNGKVRLSIAATPSKHSNKINLIFSVQDNGEGILLEDQSKIFQTFYQGQLGTNSTKTTRKGLGLGLPIANHILSLMGSTLKLTSEPGTGTDFSFAFECEILANIESTSFDALPIDAFPRNVKVRRVLLVDDEPEVLNFLRDAVEFLEFKADCFQNGQAAIDALSKNFRNWDCVITDQMMKDGSGWDVLQYARENCPGLPVVLLSGIEAERPVGMPVGLEFDVTLRKPVSLKNLSSVLESLTPNAPALKLPEANELGTLLSLVKLGEVSAIEEWCTEIALKSPECQAFTQEVQSAVKRLDFRRLEVLALG